MSTIVPERPAKLAIHGGGGTYVEPAVPEKSALR